MSNAFGATFGITRSWTGLNDSGQVGNGWALDGLPYLVVKRNQTSGAHNGIVTLVERGTRSSDFFFDFGVSALTSRTSVDRHMTYTPPSVDGSGNRLPGEFKLTQDDGSVYTFYDLPRDTSSSGGYSSGGLTYGRLYSGGGYANQPTNQWFDTSTGSSSLGTTAEYVFGALKSFNDASGRLKMTSTYSFGSGGAIAGQNVVRTDGSGKFERFRFTYGTIANTQTGASGSTISEVVLERGTGTSGNYDPSTVSLWSKVRSASYTYYAGISTDADAAFGRLGDLKTVTILDYLRNSSGDTVDQKYYRYNKFHGQVFSGNGAAGYPNDGPLNGISSSNDTAAGMGGTGGTDTTFASQTGDNAVWSGLAAAVEGVQLAKLRSSIYSYQTATTAQLQPYADHLFWYERYNAGDIESIDATVTRYRVVQETAVGTGCSQCSSGIGTFKYVYSGNSNAKADYYAQANNGGATGDYNQPNTWVAKTIEYLPDTTNADTNSDGIVDADQWLDNDKSVVYSNQLGEPVFKVVKEYSKSVSLSGFSGATYGDSGDEQITLTASNHGYLPGDLIEVRGATSTSPDLQLINGTWTVIGVTSSSVTLSRKEVSGVVVIGGPYWSDLFDLSGSLDSGTQSSRVYATQNRYDNAGRLTYAVHSSAILGYDESLPDLIGFTTSASGAGDFGRYEGGLIEVYQYGTSTGATSGGSLGNGITTANSGDVTGYIKAQLLANGFQSVGSSSFVPVKQYAYYEHDYNGQPSYPLASVLQCWDANGDGTLSSGEGSSTTYTYSYRQDTSSTETNRILIATTNLPVVSTATNGSGTGDTMAEAYDAMGRTIWTKDAGGYLTYTAYDTATGSVIKQIADVDTTQTSTFSALPSWWSTPTGGGLQLVTSFTVDALGRATSMTDPSNRISLTTYDDVDHESRYYPGWTSVGSGVWSTTGPIQVSRTYWPIARTSDAPGDAVPANQQVAFTEQLLIYQTFSTSLPTGVEAFTYSPATVKSLSRSLTNNAGQTVEVDSYYAVPTGSSWYSSSICRLGGSSALSNSTATSGGIYHAMFMDYDSRGRLKRTETSGDPSTSSGRQGHGTVTRYIYDARGLLTQTWVGTDDTDDNSSDGIIYWSPDNASNAEFNLIKTSEARYDADGNKVRSTTFTGTNAASGRLTLMWYDWRDRLVAAKTDASVDADNLPDPGSESSTDQRPLVTYDYDNLDRLTTLRQYDGDGVTISFSGGMLSTPDISKVRGMSQNQYDAQGRVFSSSVFGVNPVTGLDATTGNADGSLNTDSWYDSRGNVVKMKAPGGLVTKSSYDGAGRLSKVFSTDGNADSTYANALSISDDIVLEQTEYTYDGSGNVILTVTRQRVHSDPTSGTSAQGALGGPTTSGNGSVKARVSYINSVYDLANRRVQTINVGTNGGSSYTLTTNAVSGSTSSRLVTTYTYDIVGSGDYAGVWGTQTTDPRGINSRTYADLAGRTVWSIEAYGYDSVGTAGTYGYIGSTSATASTNRRTQYFYDGANHMIDMKAWQPGSAVQETKYIYGVSPSQSSSIYSFDLLAEIDYPDPTTGSASSTDVEKFAYDAEGKKTSWQQRTGSVHGYTYDAIGRLTLDNVSILGSGVDGSVRKMSYAYDSAGRLYRTATLNSAGAEMAVDTLTFNGLGQLLSDAETNGTVSYSYSYGLIGGAGGNNSRLTGMNYGAESLTYSYGTSGGLNDSISRLDSIVGKTFYLSGTSQGTTTLEAYDYLGLNTVVGRAHGEFANAGNLKLYNPSGDPSKNSGRVKDKAE